MLRTRSTRRTGLAAAVFVSAFALLAVAAPGASAAPAATQQATNTCWKTVVNDWLNNQPNLKGSYPIPCYSEFMPPPYLVRKPYGGFDPLPMDETDPCREKPPT